MISPEGSTSDRAICLSAVPAGGEPAASRLLAIRSASGPSSDVRGVTARSVGDRRPTPGTPLARAHDHGTVSKLAYAGETVRVAFEARPELVERARARVADLGGEIRSEAEV